MRIPSSTAACWLFLPSSNVALLLYLSLYPETTRKERLTDFTVMLCYMCHATTYIMSYTCGEKIEYQVLLLPAGSSSLLLLWHCFCTCYLRWAQLQKERPTVGFIVTLCCGMARWAGQVRPAPARQACARVHVGLSALCGGAPLTARGVMLSGAGGRGVQRLLRRVLLRVLQSVQSARPLL